MSHGLGDALQIWIGNPTDVSPVMAGLVPGIHVFAAITKEKTWMNNKPGQIERSANGRHGK